MNDANRPPAPCWQGLDVGGANLKWATSEGRAQSEPFPLWSRPGDLSATLAAALADCPGRPLAVTMTGELADCFLSKRQGVEAIVAAVQQAAGNRPVQFYQLGGGWAAPSAAAENWSLTAAANWSAIATCASKLFRAQSGFLLDWGSTTLDAIPVREGVPAIPVQNDRERLANGQLVYVGTRRTPLCGLIQELTREGTTIGLAREWFATSHDLLLVHQLVPERPNDCDTADRQPATRLAAQRRLARSFCADLDELPSGWLEQLSRDALQRLIELVQSTVRRVVRDWPDLPLEFALSGSGAELLARWLPPLFPGARWIDCRQTWGEAPSDSAGAYAVARLAASQCLPDSSAP